MRLSDSELDVDGREAASGEVTRRMETGWGIRAKHECICEFAIWKGRALCDSPPFASQRMGHPSSVAGRARKLWQPETALGSFAQDDGT